jgi:protein-tyrosine phosphatase
MLRSVFAASAHTDLVAQQQRSLARFGTTRWADVHCHLLPGLDDGPKTLDASLELAQQLVVQGLTDVVASPHQLGEFELDNHATLVDQRVAQLQQAIDDRGIPLRLHAGGDVRVDDRLVELLSAEPPAVSAVGATRRYFLLELPHNQAIAPGLVVPTLIAAGFTPVLTHPERNDPLQREPDLLDAWYSSGAVIQLTAGSVVGDFGPAAEDVSWHWLRRGVVHVIASDAHDTRRRPPRWSACVDALTKGLNHVIARKLVIENPLHVLDGEPVVPIRRGIQVARPATPEGAAR